MDSIKLQAFHSHIMKFYSSHVAIKCTFGYFQKNYFMTFILLQRPSTDLKNP